MNESIQKNEYNSIIIGSGAAAYNCADCLFDSGIKDIAIITESINAGTSRNTGSDKQTYYKLGLAGKAEDSVYKMAKTLFDGGGADGDVCLTEAANSLKSFFKLCSIGVPFPTNEYGEYVGYKTDHDPAQRATSAGPLTSRMMTEALEREVKRKNIPCLDGQYAVKIHTEQHEVRGVAVIEKNNSDKDFGLKIFNCKNLILATGGCASVYFNSVYPESHYGSSSLAIDCGAQMSNLCEWQYGLASIKFRWNVSGTYQQVLPRYVSIDKNGREYEFLYDYFQSPYEALNMVFLKGYQWPFDSKKTEGSSLIDIIIHNEINNRGRRVFMDYTAEPSALKDGGFENLSIEAYNYLKNSNALISLPINRLKTMNAKAIELYKSNGIDLEKEYLEVAVCSQHINGGVYINTDYESSVKNLYVCGEAAGVFGIYRPGGAALNSTQVGGLRIAEKIYLDSLKNENPSVKPVFDSEKEKESLKNLILKAKGGKTNLAEKRVSMQKKMSECAAYIRNIGEIKRLKETVENELKSFYEMNKFSADAEAVELLKNRDILVCQLAVLDSIIYQYNFAGSRGGAVFTDSEIEFKDKRLENSFKNENKELHDKIIITRLTQSGFISQSRPRKPLPEKDDWFENVWNNYNKKRKIGGEL